MIGCQAWDDGEKDRNLCQLRNISAWIFSSFEQLAHVSLPFMCLGNNKFKCPHKDDFVVPKNNPHCHPKLWNCACPFATAVCPANFALFILWLPSPSSCCQKKPVSLLLLSSGQCTGEMKGSIIVLSPPPLSMQHKQIISSDRAEGFFGRDPFSRYSFSFSLFWNGGCFKTL